MFSKNNSVALNTRTLLEAAGSKICGSLAHSH